ncbi:retrovirus-related Pol polyprotein from transposon 17.6 [Trichonephila clavipes]|nr:retrovirus-related Pol polyprotein from transposon 17.6 [Trichonephila clavipes]
MMYIKSAIITPFGLFESTRMQFGLCNAAATFQRFIDEVLRNLPFVFAFVDDILVASSSPEEHLQHLQILFTRLQQYGLSLKPSKCIFGVTTIKFLGFKVSESGIEPLSDRVDCILNFPQPTTLTQLRRFLGLFNFYRRFVPKAAHLLAPLNKFWKELKILKTDATLLRHPIPGAKLSLWTDASDKAVGGSLMQLCQNNWEPVAFLSVKLSKSQQKWSTYDRELLAIYISVKRFRHMLEGRDFIIYTDQKPLMYAFMQNPDKCSPRQWRHLDFISQFSTDVRHINGTHNAVADALSRIEVNQISNSFLDFEALSKAQLEDNELQSFQNDEKSSLVFKRVPSQYQPLNLSVILPLALPDHLYHIIFVGPYLSIFTKLTLVLQHLSNSSHPDMFGQTCGKQWPEAVAIENITAETVSRAIFDTWISRFGCPVYLTTGQGRQFEAALFKELTKFLGTNRIRTTSYHPQANGLVERLHRVLKSALMAHENIKWTETLPAVLLGLRVAVKPDINASSAELVYGVSLRLPAEICTDTSSMPLDYGFVQQLKNHMNHLKPLSTSTHGFSKIFVHPKLDDCSHVFLRVDKVSPLLSQPYTGPHEVLSRNDKHITIKINGKKSCVSLDRVKPAFVFKDLPDTIPDPIISAESSHRHPVTTNMQTTKSGRRKRSRIIFIREPYDNYGSFENNTWTGMVGMLYRKEVDFILNPIIPKVGILEFAYFTNPITIEAFTILSGKKIQEAGFFLYFSVLNNSVWMTMIITLTVVAATSAILYIKVQKTKTFSWIETIGRYCWNFLSNMLKQRTYGKSTGVIRNEDTLIVWSSVSGGFSIHRDRSPPYSHRSLKSLNICFDHSDS